MKLITDFILVTGIVVTLIILFSLFKKKKKETPHRILIFLFLIMLFVAVNFYAELHRLKILYATTLLIEDAAELLVGPLLFVYIKSIFSNEPYPLKKNRLHFLPALIYVLTVPIPLLSSIFFEEAITPYLNFMEENFSGPLFLFQAPYLLFYAVLSFSLLKKYQRSLKQNYSNLLEKDLKWVKYLLIGIIITISIDISTTVYELAFGDLDWNTGYLTVVAMILMIVFLGYYGTSQSQIFLPDFMLNEEKEIDLTKEKIQKPHHLSNADDTEIQDLKKRLEEILKNEKPYLNEDLTLGGLAKLLPTTDKKLSALLNRHLEINFYDLINSYRIEEVKSRIANPDFENYTLLAVAFDSGFKSKTSFYRIFKKATGCSPSEYKNGLSSTNNSSD